MLLATICVTAQSIKNITQKYDVAVSFGSMCCGTAQSDFLANYIKLFNRTNKVILNAWQLDGCGREGEFKILFSLDKLSASKKKKLLSSLKKLIPEQNNKNKKIKASSGPISIDYDLPVNQLENCRGQLTKWK